MDFMLQRYVNPPELLLHIFRGILSNSEKTAFLGVNLPFLSVIALPNLFSIYTFKRFALYRLKIIFTVSGVSGWRSCSFRCFTM